MRLPCLAIAATLGIACRRAPDACEGALDRLARIDASRGRRALAAPWTDEVLARCRRDPAREPDPVMRCALDGATDDDAAACVDRFLADVLRPPTPGDRGAPQGLNPLLAPE